MELLSNDSNVVFVKNVGEMGQLYRVTNQSGIDYSVICEGGEEVYSAQRRREDDMVNAYIEGYRLIDGGRA